MDNTPDPRSARRDRKRASREKDARMRGNRSLQHIQQAILKRARKARERTLT